MKVCIAVESFPKLSETFILGQALALAERGVEVSVLTDAVLPFAGDAATLRRATRLRWGALSHLAPGLRRLPARQADRGRLLLDLAFSRRFAGADAVIAHYGMNGVRLARIGQRRKDFPPILTIFHGFDIGMVQHDGTLNQYEPLFRAPGLLLPVNDVFRRTLLDAGAPPDRTRVHHVGIATDAIPFRSRDWNTPCLRFLSVCRLTEKKGLTHALDALARLKDIGRDWRYDIIGDGALRPELEAQASRLGLSDRVRFLGGQPHEIVRRHLDDSHVFLQPSVTAANGDVEGIPVALMEAMAAGLIAVATHHSGIPELIADGESGFLAPERDASALATRLQWIIDHPDRLDGIARNARTTVEREFDNARQTDELISLIAGLRRE